MLKVCSVCLLFTTLVFSSAHAPTFQIWRSLPLASTETSKDAGGDATALPGALEYARYAFEREYDEGNDLERFELDEFYLPRLNVDLPELFDWSDGEYLADNSLPVAFDFGFGATSATTFGSARAGRFAAGAGFSGGGGGGGSGGSGSDASMSQTSKASGGGDGSADDAGQPSAPSGDDSSTDSLQPELPIGTLADDDQFAKNDSDTGLQPPLDSLLTPIGAQPELLEPIFSGTEPVQVPAPGALGLFVLGLAALRFVGRKKNGSG